MRRSPSLPIVKARLVTGVIVTSLGTFLLAVVSWLDEVGCMLPEDPTDPCWHGKSGYDPWYLPATLVLGIGLGLLVAEYRGRSVEARLDRTVDNDAR